jgi:protein-L-isoaspartate(D-aspartate) O-methyltransferase
MTVHASIPDYARAREAMIDSQLRPAGVNDPAVLAAVAEVAREQFVPEAARPLAYMDGSVPLGGGRFLPPATALGLLLTQLAPKPGERALIVGCGTGYSAAVLQEIGVEATGVESSPELAETARTHVAKLVEGPLEAGHERGAPYDLLLIDGAAEFVPDALVGQLKEGGRFGAALVERGVSRLIVGRKSAGSFGFYSIADWQVPPLPGFQRPRTFSF